MQKKLAFALAGAALGCLVQNCHAFGEEGHSIVAEIAQRRLDPFAQAAVMNLLGASMSSVASWSDGVKFPGRPDSHPESYNWHFVDIPLKDGYIHDRDCNRTGPGDCVVDELKRLQTALTCSPSAAARRDALRYAIHFVGDIHQPLHTVWEKQGANQQKVAGVIKAGPACGRNGCEFDSSKDASISLHFLWDTGLIRATYFDWGAYVEMLEAGVLKNPEIQHRGESLDPQQWAIETHAVAQKVWGASSDDVKDIASVFKVDDDYYKMSMPLMDAQLALAGLRLASFLNASYAAAPCDIEPKKNLGDLKLELKDYFTKPIESGLTRYEAAQGHAAGEAKNYLLARLAERHITKPAMVLDIDETSLNNLEQMQINDYGYIGMGPCTLKEHYACGSGDWDKTMRATAIRPTLELYKAAIEKGVAVFFVTGRREDADGSERTYTEMNLQKVGYTGYKRVYLRPADSTGKVSDYKAAMRAAIEAQGYHILVNLGDQPSDLEGGHAERGFPMPNPAYRIP